MHAFNKVLGKSCGGTNRCVAHTLGVPEKTHNVLTHDVFGTVRRKMKIFAPKCSAEITV